jgi:predicted peptidase
MSPLDSTVGMPFARWGDVLIAALCALSLEPFVARGSGTGFLNRTLRIDGTSHRYQVYVPPDYTDSKRWPVILFLHGSGERGSDGLLQTEVGLGTALRRLPDRYPAIVVFPQAEPEDRWPGKNAKIAIEALVRTQKQFRCDPERVYLTGISMGGNGAWYLAYRHPGRFAAVAPICGWFLPDSAHPTSEPVVPGDTSHAEALLAERLREMPIWIFHGSEDPVISPRDSRAIAARLDSLGAPVKYTEYVGVGHDAWDPAYDDPAFATWLFAQSRPEKSPHP